MAESKSNVLDYSQEGFWRRGAVAFSYETETLQLQSSGGSRQQEDRGYLDANVQGTRATDDSTQRIKSESLGIVKIHLLPTKRLKEPIDVILEHDGDGFIARTLEIPLYGYAENWEEAVESLKWEIESLYDDLIEDENFTDDWLRTKEFLCSRIVEPK